MKDEALKQKLGMEQRNRGSVGFQEALAQPEPYDQTALELCNVCGWKTLIPDDACLNCERAHPEQEPVGKLQEPTAERAWFTIAELNAWADKKLSENPHWVMPKDEPERDESPPQRTWVGLTPQERDEINEQVYGAVPHHVAFHHAIEAKLKSKNDTY